MQTIRVFLSDTQSMVSGGKRDKLEKSGVQFTDSPDDCDCIIVTGNPPAAAGLQPAVFIPKIAVCETVPETAGEFDDIIPPAAEASYMVFRLRTLLRQFEKIRNLNPLTGLPGNYLIEERITRDFLPRQRACSLIYIDINNFKAYNDRYGFSYGDKVICTLSRLMLNCARELSIPDCFNGHIGGDDFVALLPSSTAEKYGELLCSAFDATIGDFYHGHDKKRGFIIASGRDGRKKRFPFMAISLVIVSNTPAGCRDLLELNRITSYLKKIAKKRSAQLKKSLYVTPEDIEDINLSGLLKDPGLQLQERRALIEAFGERNQDMVIPALIDILSHDPSYWNRKSAAYGLGCFGRRDVVPPLLKGLDDTNPHVRTRCAEALGKIGDPQAVNVLLDCMKKEKNIYTRREITSALGRIRVRSAVPALRTALSDNDITLRRRAITALAELGATETVADLISLYPRSRRETRRIIINACSRLCCQASVGFLFSLLPGAAGQEEETFLSLERLSRLSSLQPYFLSRTDLLKQMCVATTPASCIVLIVRIIANIGQRDLSSCIIKLIDRKNARLTAEILTALSVLHADMKAEYIIEFLRNSSPAIRCAALRCAGQSRYKELLEPLRLMLKDDNDTVRELAAQAITRIITSSQTEMSLLPVWQERDVNTPSGEPASGHIDTTE